jgi:hypothetical protein
LIGLDFDYVEANSGGRGRDDRDIFNSGNGHASQSGGKERRTGKSCEDFAAPWF